MWGMRGPERLRVDSGCFSRIIQSTRFSVLALQPSSLLPISIHQDELYAEASQPLGISSIGSEPLLVSPFFIAQGSPVLSGASWEAKTQQFSVIAGNLSGSGAPRVAKARDTKQSVETVGDNCSPLADFFAKRYPKGQSQPQWKLQLSEYPDEVLNGAMEGKYLRKSKKDVVEVGRKRRNNGR